MTSAIPTAATDAARGGCAAPLDLHLAGVDLRITGDDDALLGRARTWAGAFAGCEGGNPFVIRAARRAGPAPSIAGMRADVERPPRRRWRGATLRLEGATFSATADLDRREARLEGPAVLYPLEILVRHLLPELISDGIVMHAALLEDGGRAWLASGPSGCGKSTLASLFPDRALCDERCAVRLVDGQLVACSLPYWRGRQGAAQLAGVHLLRHGEVAARCRLGSAEAMPRLIREVHFPERDPAALAAAFAVLAAVVDRVPVWELAFAPDRSVWPFLSAAAEPS